MGSGVGGHVVLGICSRKGIWVWDALCGGSWWSRAEFRNEWRDTVGYRWQVRWRAGFVGLEAEGWVTAGACRKADRERGRRLDLEREAPEVRVVQATDMQQGQPCPHPLQPQPGSDLP